MKKRVSLMGKIIIAIIMFILIIIACFLLYKMNQLKKLEAMSVHDMIAYVTENENTYVSMAIIENGEISFHTYGQNGVEIENTNLDFEIGSISKTMTALLLSKAVEEKKIDLFSPISDYLNFQENKYYPSLDRILTHTAGYKGYYFESEMIGNHLNKRNDFFGINKSKLLLKAASVSLEDKDYNFNYSNFGISVAGLVLESVYHNDYSELLTDYLKNELNLYNTTVATSDGNLSNYWNWKPDDGYIPAGAVISNIDDMAQYLNIYMTSNEEYILRPLQSMKKVDANTFFNNKMGIRIDEIGMTWIHDTDNKLIWHNGGTSHYNSYIAMKEDRSKGIVILSNYSPDYKIPVTVIGAKIMNEED